jgi:hypothetical protein
MDTTTDTIRIPAHMLATVKAAVVKAQTKIERAAARAGQTAPAAPVLTASAMFTVRADDSVEGTRFIQVIDITVTYARPCLDGWEFLAVVEPLTTGNLLRAVPGALIAEGELDGYRTCELRCDHCNTKRRRNESFVVRSTERTILVGRQCLAAFLGGKSAAAIISALAWPSIIAAASEEGAGGSAAAEVVTIGTFLAQVAACIRVDGWVSKGMARDRDGVQSTAGNAWFVMSSPPRDGHERKAWEALRARCVVTDADVTRGEAALSWARNLSGASDYEQNLRTVCGEEYIGDKYSGLVASAVAGYNRFLGDIVKREQTTLSTHVGAVGDKTELTVTVERTHTIETQYGALVINSMRTPEGAVIVWKTGRSVGEVGATVSLKGTIKAHTEYKGTAQTELTRCKVAEQISAVA